MIKLLNRSICINTPYTTAHLDFTPQVLAHINQSYDHLVFSRMQTITKHSKQAYNPAK